MKLARTIAVLTVIVVFPAMSWYYLSRGAAWRIEGLDAMREKIAIELPQKPLITDAGETLDGIGSDFIIASDVDTEEGLVYLNEIADLFKHREDVLLLSFQQRSPELNKAWTVLDCSGQSCATWKSQLFANNSNVALIDDSLFIRNTYQLGEPGQMKLLAEHGVILFPVERSKKIELKRGENE